MTGAHEFGRVRAWLYDATFDHVSLRRLFGVPAERIVELHRCAAAAAGDGTLLDAACGTARFSAAAAAVCRTSLQLIGVDRSAAMLRVAQRRMRRAGVRGAVVRGDLTALPLSDAAVDAAVCSLGLQFVAQRDAALAELRRVVRPGGRVFAAVPALGLRDRYDRRHATRARKDHPFDRATLTLDLARAGFTDVELDVVGALLLWSAG